MTRVAIRSGRKSFDALVTLDSTHELSVGETIEATVHSVFSPDRQGMRGQTLAFLVEQPADSESPLYLSFA